MASKYSSPLISPRYSSIRREVIDRHPTTGHDQLEPALRIGEDANILQWVTINNQQIGIGSRGHHAYLSFEAQQACRCCPR